MPKRTPDRVASEWTERARHDWETARLLAGLEEFHPDVVGVLIQQALEKFLKGYLISKGWELEKTHDLERLCKIAERYDKEIHKYVDLCIEVGDFYITGRYPPIIGEELSREDVIEALGSVSELIAYLLRRA